jgi:hypothetical protein
MLEPLLGVWNKIARGVFDHYICHPLPGINHKEFPRAVLLDLPPYQQVSTYSCGFVVGLTVLHYFYPNKSTTAFLRCTGLTEEDGVNDRCLARALRRSGIIVEEKRSLSFTAIKRAIREGNPIIVVVQRPATAHDVVITGFQARPNVIILGNENWRRSPKPLLWQDFVRVWAPRGWGLICRQGK